MNNENPNVEENQNMGVVPEEVSETPVSQEATESLEFQTIDPTAAFQTVDPTTVSNNEAVPTVENVTPTETTPEAVEGESASEQTAEVLAPVETPSDSQTRYNPVTGEEMTMGQLLGTEETTVPATVPETVAPTGEEKKKEVDYKPTSKANTVLLILFFLALILFVVFLPDIQNLIALYKAGPQVVEEVTTGKLVCTLESSTVNLDRNITRVFTFTDNKLQSAKFTTEIRGDATLDEEALNELNEQCELIKANVDGIKGVNVSCTYEEGRLIEKESFDYATYSVEEVSSAYTEAGGSILEYEYEQDIDKVMTNMRQGGFTCNKEK